LPKLGVYEFTLYNGYKPRPEYQYGLYRTEKYQLQYGNIWVYEEILAKSSFGSIINNIDPAIP
jgi:hypothetical protein